jgi:hypothetical protein
LSGYISNRYAGRNGVTGSGGIGAFAPAFA